MTEETNNNVVKLTPEILQSLINECMTEQDLGTGPLINEHEERIVKLDMDTLKYFIYETIKGRRVTMLLEHPELTPLLQN